MRLRPHNTYALLTSHALNNYDAIYSRERGCYTYNIYSEIIIAISALRGKKIGYKNERQKLWQHLKFDSTLDK